MERCDVAEVLTSRYQTAHIFRFFTRQLFALQAFEIANDMRGLNGFRYLELILMCAVVIAQFGKLRTAGSGAPTVQRPYPQGCVD